MRQFLIVLFIMTMIPYVTTLAWTGRLETGRETGNSGTSLNGWEIVSGKTSGETAGSDRTVVVIREDGRYEVPVEEYLFHVLAAQIPVEFEMETLKAQAILARTYIYGLMDGRQKIYEEELDMDAISLAQMKVLWGETNYLGHVARFKEAIKETDGRYLLHDGVMITPFFCYASAGMTRSYGEAYPYLKQAESAGDLRAENYRSMPVFEVREFAKRINEIPGAVAVSEYELMNGNGIQIVERDGAGYVKQIQIGQKTYTGEEVQYALGLASSCYSFERLDGKIRAICKGIGHGYGFAQFGANEMAKEGRTYEELLHYYFQNIEIVGR